MARSAESLGCRLGAPPRRARLRGRPLPQHRRQSRLSLCTAPVHCCKQQWHVICSCLLQDLSCMAGSSQPQSQALAPHPQTNRVPRACTCDSAATRASRGGGAPGCHARLGLPRSRSACRDGSHWRPGARAHISSHAGQASCRAIELVQQSAPQELWHRQSCAMLLHGLLMHPPSTILRVAGRCDES